VISHLLNCLLAPTDLKKQLDDKLADLQANSAKRSADLTKTASDKQLSIIQESVNRLRNAFASSTAFSIADVFGGGKNAAQGIEILKKNLEAFLTVINVLINKL
jgi:hypothetical protein